MVVLIALALFVAVPAVQAEMMPEVMMEVYYDRGDPNNSVAIVGDELLELNDMYELYRLHAFDLNAVVFQHEGDSEMVKYAADGHDNEVLRKGALHLFVIKQLKAIHAAQARYHNMYYEGYADSLETLVKHEFLADGFKDWIKHGYYFEVVSSGQTPRHAMKHENIPTFLVSASPVKPRSGDLFFTVDHLELIRVGDSKSHATWGPVWDYQEHSSKQRWKDISLDEANYY